MQAAAGPRAVQSAARRLQALRGGGVAQPRCDRRAGSRRHAASAAAPPAAGAGRAAGGVGSAPLDWRNLGFDFRHAAGYVKYEWANGEWDEGEFVTEPYFKVHVMSAAIHYGQGIFEGAKAHHCKDGEVRLWNIQANSERMARGARRMLMPEVPPEMFRAACETCVRQNAAFVPPYGSGGSMYLRPFLFGHGPQLGLTPAPQYTFAVLGIPVGSYYKSGLRPIDAVIPNGYDRCAPLGVGNVKASGNYGADIQPSIQARAEGYPTVLYLDAKEHRYIEEFSVSNFIGVLPPTDGAPARYVTPASDSILVSTTNELLMVVAEERLGMRVERRPVPVEELSSFSECAGCGTAVVMMGLRSITHGKTRYTFRGIETVERLYNLYRAIQFGEEADPHGWGTVVPLDG